MGALVFWFGLATGLWLRLRKSRTRAATAKAIGGILGLLLVLGLVSFGLYAFDWDSLISSKLSDYTLVCACEWTNGGCAGNRWMKRDHTDYSVFPDRQTVIRQGPHQPPERLANCAVVDQKNWKCQAGSRLTDGAALLVGYTDGKFWDGLEWTNQESIVKFPSAEGVKHVSRWEYLVAPDAPSPKEH